MSERVEWVEDPAVFSDLAEPWAELTVLDGHPFNRPEWFAAWWGAYGASSRLSVATAWRGEELVGVLPLHQRGRTLAALADSDTPLFTPLARDATARRALLAAACARAPRLFLEAVPERVDGAGEVLAAARAAGLEPLRRNGPTSLIVDTGQDWRETTGRSWRRVGRYGRALARDHGTTLRVIEVPADPVAELEAGLGLQDAGWKGRNGTSALRLAGKADFWRRFTPAFAARGTLRISSLDRPDGPPIAWELQLVEDGRLWGLWGAFDEDFRQQYPGLVLKVAMLERCAELGLEAYEFVGGDEPYKRKFATDERRHLTLELYRRAPAPLAQFASRRVAAVAVRTLRRARARRAGAPTAPIDGASVVPAAASRRT